MTDILSIHSVNRVDRCVLTVGTFDGVHLGHKGLVEYIVSLAKKELSCSTIVTFDPHPREIIHPDGKKISLLTTMSERAEILGDFGIDQLIVIPFDRDFSLMDSEQFIRSVIWDKIGVSHFVIGYDHHFGKNREGSVETVKQLGKELGFDTTIYPRQDIDDCAISSTRIRKLLSEIGNVKEAVTLLGRPYQLTGTVIRGDQRGRLIGYPTANIIPDDERKQIPFRGVYAVKIQINSKSYEGMLNIGFRPTFSGTVQSIETHIFNFDQDIYGQNITLRFIDRIRDEKKFESLEELKEQLISDEITVKRLLDTI